MKKYFLQLSTILVSLFILGTLTIVLSFGFYFSSYANHKQVLKEQIVEIPHGSSLRKVAEILEREKIIESAKNFFWYARLGHSRGEDIQAGYYLFDGALTHRNIINRLLLGQERSYKIIFKEGETLVDLATMLEDFGICTKKEFALAMADQEILDLINPKVSEVRRLLKNGRGGIEGYLYPDTYFFRKKDSAFFVIKKMYEKLMSVLDDSVHQGMRDKNLDLHTLLTLASIVEKETGAAFERPLIAGVYLNRLKIGMRLQADPTVIYGIKDYDGKIRKKDLLTYHPYNTYKINGLPPGPIAAPGLDSIKAVLWPAETKNLYFVSRNDGTHIFCPNLECHNKAVKIWQIDYFKKMRSKK